MPNDTDYQTAVFVMGWQDVPGYNYWMTFGEDDSFELHGRKRVWSPTCDKKADEQVNAHVLATWNDQRTAAYEAELRKIRKGKKGYAVGDYCKAALAAKFPDSPKEPA